MYLDEYLRVLPVPAKRAVYRTVWNPDKWNRQSLVARLADGWESGLDVGGRASEMDSLCETTNFISCNPRAPTDVMISAEDSRLPFASGSFDVVTSSDVIEHIPVLLRAEHLGELVRIARRRVVACFPLGSERHLAAEERLAATLSGLGIPVPEFLAEHLEFGLPTPAQVAEMASAQPSGSVRIFYQGNFVEGDEMLVAGLRLRYLFDPRSLAAFLSAGRRVRNQRRLDPAPEANSARVFLIIDHGAANQTPPARGLR